MSWVLTWLAVGFISSLMAVFVFRRDGRTFNTGELYLAVLGPVLGPVVAVLLLVDFFKRMI